MAPCFYNFNSFTGAIRKTSGFQNPQDCHCMVAGVELEKYVTGSAISNRRSEKQSSPYTADLDCYGQQIDRGSGPIAF